MVRTVIRPLGKISIQENLTSSIQSLFSMMIQADEESDVPVLNNLSWPDLWNEVLSTDFAGVEFPAQNGGLEMNNSAIFDPGDGIESCATHNLLPLSHNLSPELDLTSQYLFTTGQAPTPPPEQICYGMIHRAAVKVQGDMPDVEAKLKAGNGSVEEGFDSFSLTGSDDRLVLEFPDGSTFGTLNTHTTSSLKDLLDKPSVEFDALGPTTQIREAIERAINAKDALVRVHINIYGPKDTAEEIGHHLSQHKTYLQRPDVLRRGVIYNNPH
ncbi:hypothetical protein HYALB_00011389 [Hymenoscyphus albidus]|uniref:Uncharacterized protein n=1 Tax=Hymenoscyphus albidus TaxID=595503 RepID=A0A9N9LCA8_9HELO|nr:hypothetical protein HYALB_00011389 [Hymenoscyphus albidus]